MPSRTRPSPWAWYVAVSAVVFAAYVIAALAGASVTVCGLLVQASFATSLGGMLVGIRLHRPTSWWPWLLVVCLTMSLIAGFLPGIITGTVPIGPGPADVLYLLVYALGAVALMLILRRRTPGWDMAGLIDAWIIAVAAGLLSWVYLISPAVGDTGTALTTRLVSAAYPLGDLLLAALGVRLLLSTPTNSAAARALLGYLALTIVPDTLHNVRLFDTGTGLGLIATLWMISTLFLGLVGMHPSMRELDAPSSVAAPDAGPLRLIVLAFASLLAPATQLIQYLRGAPLHVPLTCACCGVLFLLVIARLAGLVATQRRMAVTDDLTSLRSRRYFREALTKAPTSDPRGTAVVMLDIDHFKQVNDTYGHDGGDRVLREVARRLSDAIRPGDVLARYGGEEFAILLPRTSPGEARRIADRVHAAVRETPVPVSATVAIPVTVSVGVASMPADVTEPDRLPLLADQLLYQAKDAGRDRVNSGADRPHATAAA